MAYRTIFSKCQSFSLLCHRGTDHAGIDPPGQGALESQASGRSAAPPRLGLRRGSHRVPYQRHIDTDVIFFVCENFCV